MAASDSASRPPQAACLVLAASPALFLLTGFLQLLDSNLAGPLLVAGWASLFVPLVYLALRREPPAETGRMRLLFCLAAGAGAMIWPGLAMDWALDYLSASVPMPVARHLNTARESIVYLSPLVAWMLLTMALRRQQPSSASLLFSLRLQQLSLAACGATILLIVTCAPPHITHSDFAAFVGLVLVVPAGMASLGGLLLMSLALWSIVTGE